MAIFYVYDKKQKPLSSKEAFVRIKQVMNKLCYLLIDTFCFNKVTVKSKLFFLYQPITSF
jgi:hypothetical protein